MKKIKIQIKSVAGTVLFEYESEDNTIRKTLEQAVMSYADLSYADLSYANLSYANLRYANLRYADLSSADLSYADLSYANLSSANLSSADLSYANLRYANLSSADLSSADLSSANLRSANLSSAKNIPQSYINQCSRDILFVFQSLKKEVPFLKEKLLKGEIDGTQYEGDCACLIGTLANADGGLNKVCSAIPFYDKGLHNFGEQWFYQIRKGDTPENNQFAKHVLDLIDMVLKPKKKNAK